MSEKSGTDRSADAWIKCDGCGMILYRKELSRHAWVCPNCTHHFRVGSTEFIAILADEGSFQARHESLRSKDPLNFADSKKYTDRIKAADAKGGASEAVVTGMATVHGLPVALAIMDFGYMGGSMGSVVGERIARITGNALTAECPLIIVSASGGARMQEGILSLMQMAKTSAMLGRLREKGIPFISVLTHPTTGGVTASYSTLGDVILAEPNALIGFAGPRVIRETINEDLPEGFQRSEFLLAHGLVDRVVDRREMRDTLGTLLAMFADARTLARGDAALPVDTDEESDARPDEEPSADSGPSTARFTAPPLVPNSETTDMAGNEPLSDASDSPGVGAAEADDEGGSAAPQGAEDAPIDAEEPRPEIPVPEAEEKVARVEGHPDRDNDPRRAVRWLGSDDAPSPGTP